MGGRRTILWWNLLGRNCFNHYFLMFAAVTEQIFKIASMEPGAMLYEASREFEVR